VVVKMRPICVPEATMHSVSSRARHYTDSAARHRRVLNVTAMISAAITAFSAAQSSS
jgi:adenylate cyclase